MRHKLTFVAGFTLGYTLGARAGRDQYERLLSLARTAAESPAIQGAAGVLQAQATELLSRAARTVREQMAQAVGHGPATPQAAYPESMFAASSAGPSANGGPHPG